MESDNPFFGIVTGGLASVAEYAPYLLALLVFVVLVNLIEGKAKAKRRGRPRGRGGWRERAPRSGAPHGWRGAWPPSSDVGSPGTELEFAL